jgi:repressor LexA
LSSIKLTVAYLFDDVVGRMKDAAGVRTDRALASVLGISPPALTNFKNKGELPPGLLLGFSQRYRLSMNWLLTGEGSQYEALPVAGARIPVSVPVLGRIPAGFPDMVNNDSVIEYVGLPAAPSGSYALVVHGDSMSPGIKDGDYVLFIPDAPVKSGDVVVVTNEWGEPVLMRYREKDGEEILVSDNAEYAPVKPNEHYKILGKVLDVWRKVKV